MDDTITQGIVYGDFPPKGIYFTVIVEYNHDNSIFEGKVEAGTSLVSNPIGTFNEAMRISDRLVMSLSIDKFAGAKVCDVDPEDHGGYHCFLNDKDQNTIARVSIATYDVRKETFH